jgi:AraC-like DNA-binding protein
VTRDLKKPPSVKDLAAQLRLSVSRFEHLFKQETGRSLKAFVRMARMAKAKTMLEDRTLRVKEVADAVGYNNMPNFVRDFRKEYGKSPSQLRRSLPRAA